MEKLSVALCDDLPEERQKILSLLEQSHIPTTCRVFQSGEELLSAFHPSSFDLLLMDIYMEGITGVETVKKIREIDSDIPVAFITTSTDHALESYRLSALKYLEKPIDPKEIDDLLKIVKLNKENIPSLIIRQNGLENKIPFADIIYLEQQAHHVLLFLRNESCIQIYKKLSTLFPQLDGSLFLCPHKSYCVNLKFIRSINAEFRCFVMANGKNVPISRPNMSKAKKAYEDFLFAQTRGNG